MEKISEERGIIKIKPIFIGIYHYNFNYGSVCSPDIEGTPPLKKSSYEEIKEKADKMVKYFVKNLNLDFVKIDTPYIIYNHRDLRLLPRHLTYDIDAFLVGRIGDVPLILRSIERYGLPLIYRADNKFLRALHVKKYLKESKFLYIGEIPSFSAPKGPWDFFKLEDKFGIRFKHIDTGEFFKVFDSFSEQDVRRELEKWRKVFDKLIE